ncbi:MAG: hypothetical protein GXP08_05105 [Gammaproteobacteria bacterium]|nr:hypothetical protein [Gammaproteobacteria bacterium]
MNGRNNLLKFLLLLSSLFYSVLGGISVVFAQTCPTPPTPDSNWIETWSDQFNQTTYTITAPCKVFIGVPFNITATVTDTTYPLTSVAVMWSLEDNGVVIAGGGFNWLDVDAAGQWQLTLTPTYTGEPIDHLLNFKFMDLGKGGGAHWWRDSIIGNITVDPFPPSVNTLPVVSTPPVLLADIQTMRNEEGAVPWVPSTPWLTTAVRNVTVSGAELALERSEVTGALVNVPETLGYVAIDSDKIGSFKDSLGNTIRYETRTTDNFIKGWHNGCALVSLAGSYNTAPLVLANKISHNDTSGGWLRRCSLSESSVGLVVDEDRFRDRERRHRVESAGLVLFSQAFKAIFSDAVGTWRMEAGKVMLPDTGITPGFTAVSFKQVYNVPPVVTVLATSAGKEPSALRIRNVTTTGFEIVQVEHLKEDGAHAGMTIDYLAVAPGIHFLPDGTRLIVNTLETNAVQHGVGPTDPMRWESLSFDQP